MERGEEGRGLGRGGKGWGLGRGTHLKFSI